MTLFKLSKCCFCLPLRKGLLFTGYLKLVINLLGLVFLILAIMKGRFFVPFGFVSIYMLNIIIDLTLIVAAHKENVKLFKVYFYYCIVMWSLYTVTICMDMVIDTNLMIGDFCGFLPVINMFLIDDGYWVVPICNLLFYSYILVLIRNEVILLEEPLESEPDIKATPNNVTEV